MTHPIISEEDFPRIGLRVGDQKKFFPTREVASLLDSGLAPTEFTGDVLEADFSVRDITPDERRILENAADEYGGAK